LAENCNSTETRNVTIDTILPSINFVSPTPSNGSRITDTQIIFINISATDANLKNITIYIYNSTFGILNYSNTTLTNLYSNFTLVDGIYYFNATACDNSENCNWTETRQILLTDAAPNTGTIGGGGDGKPPVIPPEEPPIVEPCEKTWSCGDWGECVLGIQRRECSLVGEARCTSPADTEDRSQTCSVNETCIENWNCGWSACINNRTTPENCIDANNCGTQTNKPTEQTCTSLTDEDCLPDLTCEDWSECKVNYGIYGIGTETSGSTSRTCTDKNECIANILEEKSCLISIDVNSTMIFEEGKQTLGIFDRWTGEEVAKIQVYDSGNKTIFKVVLNSIGETTGRITSFPTKKENNLFWILLPAFGVILFFIHKFRKEINHKKEHFTRKAIMHYHMRHFKQNPRIKPLKRIK